MNEVRMNGVQNGYERQDQSHVKIPENQSEWQKTAEEEKRKKKYSFYEIERRMLNK